MRTATSILIAFLVAGCLGPGSPPAATEVEPVPAPSLKVLVTDTEWVPVPNATVFVDGEVTTYTTDEFGAAELPLPNGSFVVKAWAPSYYRNNATGNSTGDDDAKVHVLLEKRGDDVRYETTHIIEGLCYAGVGVPNPQNRCQSSPDCSIPLSNCAGPRASIVLPLPQAFHNLSVRLNWEKEPDAQDLMFIVRLYPAASFADGREEIVLEGPSPVDFHITAAAMGPNVTFGDAWIQFFSAVSGDPDDWAEVPVVSSQPFTLDAYLLQRYALPPAVSW